MRNLTRGITDLRGGLSFLGRHRGLWPLVLAPSAVTAAVLVALVLLVARISSGLVASATAHLPSWLNSLAGWALTALIVLAIVVVAWVMFAALASALAGPFCELLSEAVEARLDGRADEPFRLGAFLREALVGLVHSLRRLLASLAVALLLLAVSFIPGLGAVLAVVVGVWYTAVATAYDCYDAVLARRAWPYRDKLAFLRAHRARTLGLGLGVTGLMMIPLVNLLALGIGAVGATLAARELGAGAPRR
ncbi:MAG: EI24 domain-containing protein [Kofleriaceae bacterium]